MAAVKQERWEHPDAAGDRAPSGAPRHAPSLPLALDHLPPAAAPIERRADRRPRRRATPEPAAEALSTIAHELRTPLATLQVSLELLTEFPTLHPGEVAELVGRLQRSVTWLDCLVENLVTWSDVETEGLILRRTRVPMREWVESALALVQPLLDRRDQRVELICPLVAPLVDGDVTRLGQALINLLVNAGKYSVWGDRLLVTIADERDCVRVSVIDHGDGVLPEERARIFRHRTRGLAALSSGERGHGLGLHVVKGIVEAHGGTVGVDSDHGQGATFWFTLPRVTATASDDTPYSW